MKNNLTVTGIIKIEPSLSDYDKSYLINFNLTPHYKRNVDEIEKRFKGEQGYMGDYGEEGEFFVKNFVDIEGLFIMDQDSIPDNDTIIENKPPSSQPSIHCPWKPSHTKGIICDLQFSSNIRWLKWLIKNFFIPNGYDLNGTVIIKDNTSRDKYVIVESNEIKYKIKDNGDILSDNLDKKFTSDFLSSPTVSSLTIRGMSKKDEIKEEKKNKDVVDRIFSLTFNGELKWSYIKSLSATVSHIYKSELDLKNNIYILINLAVRRDKKTYMSITLRKNDTKRHIRVIRNSEINIRLLNLLEKYKKMNFIKHV